MTLGPSTLQKAPLRSILKRPQFQAALKQFANGQIQWSDAQLGPLKLQIRNELRRQQDGRCIYCRRPLKIERRNACEDIEHFLDKSKGDFRKWAFCCVNLSLACHACNLEKSTRNLGSNLTPPAGVRHYVRGPGQYVWIHPFFDDFHQHIDVGRGWTYRVKANPPFAAQAQKLIDDLKLIQIQQIEARAEEIKNEISRLTVLAMECLRRRRPNHAAIALAASKALQDATTFG